MISGSRARVIPVLTVAATPTLAQIGEAIHHSPELPAVHAELLANGVVFEKYPIEGNFSSDDGQQPWKHPRHWILRLANT